MNKELMNQIPIYPINEQYTPQQRISLRKKKITQAKEKINRSK